MKAMVHHQWPEGENISQCGARAIVSDAEMVQKEQAVPITARISPAWSIRSSQMEQFPEVMDIELTRTGLGLFKPWAPPGEA